ncbi:uncharacterized protein LOC106142595 [Amyelois transitella]|uniref:uncharacterized protein LOC106142595 n=1 Tax=Amyelois transitella TaxID=680683 RepID=UPI00067E5E03|nr:uncharacterized protein LOC106142595 [Amyelois transitella]
MFKMEVQKYCQTLKKIKLLFEKLETPNYVMNNYYADAFINKLLDRSDPEIAQLATMPLMSDLIADSLSRSENYHISVKVFLTRLLGLASRKELHFAKMFALIGDNVAKNFKEIHSPSMNASLRVAFLEVALSLVRHFSGMMWLIRTGVWKDILMLVNEKRTVFVVRQVYQFVAKFMWALNDFGDVNNINIALTFILAPIQDIGLVNLNILSDENEIEICKKIEPMCHMLLAICSEKDRIRTASKLMNCLISECFIITNIGMFFGRLRSEETILMCAKIIFWATLSSIFQLKPLEEGVTYTQEDFLGLNAFYFNTLRFLIQRRNTKLVLEFCSACNMIWNMVWQNQKPFMNENDKKLEMQTQILFICVVPLMIWITMGRTTTEIMEEEIIVMHMKNIVNNIYSEHTMRAAYGIRDLMTETDVMSTVMQTVKMLTCLKTHLTDEQANIMFQSLFFVIKDYDPLKVTESDGEGYSECSEKIVVMCHVMEIILSLVKNYNITWNESLEVLCLYGVVHGILKKPNLPPKFVVVSLNVLALSVKKFLTPNLSLLLESTPGSAVYEIGSLINTKMNDLRWEVRDSALELLFVCTDLSYIKFPPFQKQIMEENLINVAAAIALNDYESYVQASALKCLGAASRVTSIWEQLKTEYPNIQEQILAILRTNSEGIVRKEACNVLCEIYQHVKLSAIAKHTLYEYMVSSALSDFHWEVQISALKFWRIVIQTLLTEQGMLDGTFPPVTFSKESRKIVTLNAAEIQKRLLKVLDELSSIGCLTVLVKLLNNDSETEIMELALNISLELLDILNKHKLRECIKPNEGDPITADDLICSIKEDDDSNDMETLPSYTERADNIIEGILKSDDINLLANIYDRHMSLQNSDSEQVKPKIRLLKSASPYLFVNHVTSKDFKAILEQNKQWKEGIRSLSSLLDDILGIYEVNEDVNSLDCY